MAKKPSGARKTKRGAMTIDARKTYRVLVHMAPHESARHLETEEVDHCCMPQPHRHQEGHRQLHAFATGSAIDALKRKGRVVHILADTSVEGKEAQKNVGTGDRFRRGRSGPPGVGELI
jgi:hypothetical protein